MAKVTGRRVSTRGRGGAKTTALALFVVAAIAATATSVAEAAGELSPASPPGLLRRWLPWPTTAGRADGSGGTGNAAAASSPSSSFPARDNRAVAVSGAQLHELTAALARASVDPKTPAPPFWNGVEEEEEDEDAEEEEEQEQDGAKGQRRRQQRWGPSGAAAAPPPRPPLPRAVAVLFVESWRDDHPHSVALRGLYESCLPSFFAPDAVGFAIVSHQGLLFPTPEPESSARGGGGGGGGSGGGARTDAAVERRRRSRRRRNVRSGLAALPLASAVRALPAVHVFGPGVGKGPGWHDKERQRRKNKGDGGSPAQPPGAAAAAPSSSAPLLRRARYNGRHHLAPLVLWLADATGERPLLSPDEAARLHCGFEGPSAAEAAVRAGGRACPLADAADASAGGWRCDFWDGEPTAEEMRRAWESPTMLACALIVGGRAIWWLWPSVAPSPAEMAALRRFLPRGAWWGRRRRRRGQQEEQEQDGRRGHAHADWN